MIKLFNNREELEAAIAKEVIEYENKETFAHSIFDNIEYRVRCIGLLMILYGGGNYFFTGSGLGTGILGAIVWLGGGFIFSWRKDEYKDNRMRIAKRLMNVSYCTDDRQEQTFVIIDLGLGTEESDLDITFTDSVKSLFNKK